MSLPLRKYLFIVCLLDIDHAISVVIISSTGMEEAHPLKEDWYTSQKQRLNKNPSSKIIRVTSDHFILLEKPR